MDVLEEFYISTALVSTLSIQPESIFDYLIPEFKHINIRLADQSNIVKNIKCILGRPHIQCCVTVDNLRIWINNNIITHARFYTFDEYGYWIKHGIYYVCIKSFADIYEIKIYTDTLQYIIFYDYGNTQITSKYGTYMINNSLKKINNFKLEYIGLPPCAVFYGTYSSAENTCKYGERYKYVVDTCFSMPRIIVLDEIFSRGLPFYVYTFEEAVVNVAPPEIRINIPDVYCPNDLIGFKDFTDWAMLDELLD